MKREGRIKKFLKEKKKKDEAVNVADDMQERRSVGGENDSKER